MGKSLVSCFFLRHSVYHVGITMLLMSVFKAQNRAKRVFCLGFFDVPSCEKWWFFYPDLWVWTLIPYSTIQKHFIALLVLVNLLFIVLDWYCVSVSTHSLRCSICECFYRIMEHQIWQHTCVLYLQNAENEMHVISCRLCGAMEWSILLVVGHGLCQSAHSNHRVGLRAPADDVGVFLLWPSHPHLCVPGWCVVRHQRDQRRACV